MLDEAAEIGDEQGTDSKNGIAAVCALFETRAVSNAAGAGKSSVVGPAVLRPRLSAADGMVIWVWMI
jgi:hypothetical protein